MSVKSKHSTSKKDKNGRKEKKKKLDESDEDIESSEEELDLTKECHPIGYYINNREEMINQMFSVIKGNKLKAMLPPILKDYDVEQLKLQCLDQLLGMSEKRITCILDGGTLDTSSESDVVESDQYDSDEKNGTTSGSSSDGSDHSNKNFHHNDTKHKRKGESLNEGKGAKVTKQNEDSTAPEQGKTLLEILELEMRARAIRALLKQSTPKELENDETKTDNKNSTKEIEGEVVDLTECKDDEFPVCVKKENSEQKDIDKKQSTFEQIIEKSKSEKKSLAKADDKSKRLQAELELRNKLFKKKIYRTRQQRMENEEEDKNNEAEAEVLKPGSEVNVDVVFKKEANEPDEIVVEDPEEGEISTSEDEYPVVVKQEIIEPEVAEEPQEPDMDYKSQIDENVERVTAIDNGTFVHNCNLENKQDPNSDDVIEVEQSEEHLALNDDSQLTGQEHDEKSSDIQESKEMDKEEFENTVEETSWRDRWLKKDGVQKLVKSSKIYAKVKKRIAAKSQKAKEEVLVHSETVTDPKTVSPQIEVIEGSIKEYERLLGKVHEERKENEISENGNSNVLTS